MPGGGTDIAGWTAIGNGVELFDPYAFHSPLGQAQDGHMLVDLAGYEFAGGGLEQTIATESGQRYQLSFWAGNTAYADRAGTGLVYLDIDGTQVQTFTTAATTGVPLVWALRSFTFVASGSSTTLRLWNDQDPRLHFAPIDAVSVSAVPEMPAALLLAAGLGTVSWRLRRHRSA